MRSVLPKWGWSWAYYSGERSRLLRPALHSATTRNRQFFVSLHRWGPTLKLRGAKAFGREMLGTAGKIMTVITERDDVSAGDIVSKHVTEYA